MIIYTTQGRRYSFADNSQVTIGDADPLLENILGREFIRIDDPSTKCSVYIQRLEIASLEIETPDMIRRQLAEYDPAWRPNPSPENPLGAWPPAPLGGKVPGDGEAISDDSPEPTALELAAEARRLEESAERSREKYLEHLGSSKPAADC